MLAKNRLYVPLEIDGRGRLGGRRQADRGRGEREQSDNHGS
jgi:hypothetical protein